MLIRIVRMMFQPDKLAEFETIFLASRDKIRAFPGCHHLELWHDLENPNVRITHSHWESADALEAYRNSALFKTTWAVTKPLFTERPLAFSAQKADNLDS